MTDQEKLIENLESDISWLGYSSTEREIIDHIKQAIDLLREREAVIESLEHDLEVTQYNLNYYLNGNG